MSGNISQFNIAMEEFHRGSREGLDDRKAKAVSEPGEIEVIDPSSKGKI